MPPPKGEAPAHSGEEEAGAQAISGEHRDAAGPSSPTALQRQLPPLTVHEGGLSRTVQSVLDLPMFGAWALSQRLSEATLTSAVRRGERDGYPARLATASFRSGKLHFEGEIDPPSEAQITEFEKEFSNAPFPTISALQEISEWPEGCKPNDPNVFVCRDFDGRVAMIHQRFDLKDGGKGFIPWTRWSDGNWRKMEPEVLPFFGILGAKDHATLVLHEGPKGAARMKRLLAEEEDASRFPWLEELRWAAHVGWIGGVHAIDRSDWAKLAALGFKRVLIVADNDEKGLKAARRIAERLSGNVFIVAFDQSFPEGFDLGDEWPAEHFDEADRYTGPSLRDCTLPATQATILIPPEGRGPPTKVLRDEYAALVAYTTDPPRVIYRHNPSRDMRPETFNIHVAPFSHSSNTAGLVWRHLPSGHERMVYRPGSPPGTLNIDGSRCFNVFEGPQIAALKGDPAPWLQFLAHIFPDEGERHLAARWIATLIAKPAVRMRYGMLLISATQGVGKNTLGNILRAQVGPRNASFPSEASVVDSAFNGWAARKRLIFISEFYNGEKRKAYDKMKSLVTDDVIEVNEKGVNQYELENAATIIACSNSEEALHLDDEDRRWFVPIVAEQLKPAEWWGELHRWLLGDGPGIIRAWADAFVFKHGYVGTGDHAPASVRKSVIAERSRSPALKLATELAEHLTTLERRVILPMQEVRAWVALKLGFRHADGAANVGDKRLGKPETITKGLKMVPGVTVWADAKRPKIGGTRQMVVMNFEPHPEAGWPDLKQHLTDLEGADLSDPM